MPYTPPVVASVTVWGTITGTLASQTDVQSALDAKATTTHATTHKSSGSDAIALDTLAVPTDITTLNATTSLHGLMMKYPGGTSTYLRADGTWTTVTATAPDIALSVLAPAVDETITAGDSAVVARAYKIASGKKLTVGSAARMRIL